MPLVYTSDGRGRSVWRSTANETIFVCGNSTQNSTIWTSNAEAITGAAIEKVFWSTNSAVGISVARGSNTILQLFGSGFHDYEAAGLALTEWSAADVVITVPAAGVLVIELNRDSTGYGGFNT